VYINVYILRDTNKDIASAKNGISASELEDLLACDDEVLPKIYQWYFLFFSFWHQISTKTIISLLSSHNYANFVEGLQSKKLTGNSPKLFSSSFFFKVGSSRKATSTTIMATHSW
jgi:hypothetical protein